jgi:type 1 glutamine amidotransferase
MKQALIVYGGYGPHDPEGLSEIFGNLLAQEGFAVTKSQTLDAFLEDLSGYDLIVPIWTMGTLPAGAADNVARAVANGCGLAGCHGGMCDAFREDTTWQFLTGSQFVAHPGNETTYTVEITDKESELTAGLSDFTVTSEQYYLHYDPAVKVHAITRAPVAEGNHSPNGKVAMPVVYTKYWGKGKVYYNSLGHTYEVFRDIPAAKEMMRRGFLWAAR